MKAFYLGYQGVINMSQDRGYVVPELAEANLTPPTLNVTRFFRKFPASFEMIRDSNEEIIRFEFWDVPLSRLPGKTGEKMYDRIIVALKELEYVPPHMFRLIVIVQDYQEEQLSSEMILINEIGCRFEIFCYQFFENISRKHHLPKCEYANDFAVQVKMQYVSLRDFPKISNADWVSKYIRDGPGDVLRVEGDIPKTHHARLVVPSRKPRQLLPED